MDSKLFNSKFLLLAGMILVVSLSRLATNALHLWNFTPVGAMALFSGAYFKDKKLAFIIPITAMFITDLCLNSFNISGFFDGFHAQMWAVYLCFILITFIGFALQGRVRLFNVLAASLISSVLFYLVTNFAVWPGNHLYAQNFPGLLTCYVAGIPFFEKGTLPGDLFYCGVLFGGYAWASSRYPQLAIK